MFPVGRGKNLCPGRTTSAFTENLSFVAAFCLLFDGENLKVTQAIDPGARIILRKGCELVQANFHLRDLDGSG
jgi:hypothetical protein